MKRLLFLPLVLCFHVSLFGADGSYFVSESSSNISATTDVLKGDGVSSGISSGVQAQGNATGFQISGGTTSKTLTILQTLSLTGTSGTTMTFPTTSATIARTDAANTFTGVQTMTNAALTSPVVAGGIT